MNVVVEIDSLLLIRLDTSAGALSGDFHGGPVVKAAVCAVWPRRNVSSLAVDVGIRRIVRIIRIDDALHVWAPVSAVDD